MSLNIFLDDERKPSQVTWVELPLVEWLVVKNYDAFVKAVLAFGIPKFVSFDHDLADEHYQEYARAIHAANPEFGVFHYEKMKEKTGMECVKWLVDYCLRKGQPFPEYTVHTMNVIGRENIISYIESFKRAYPTVTP